MVSFTAQCYTDSEREWRDDGFISVPLKLIIIIIMILLIRKNSER